MPEDAPADFQYPRYVKMAGGDGLMHDVDLEAEPNMELLDEINRNPANNLYLLYTRQVYTIISFTFIFVF